MSTVRARRRRARARRPREEQGQQGRTLGNRHYEASPLRSVRGTFDAARPPPHRLAMREIGDTPKGWMPPDTVEIDGVRGGARRGPAASARRSTT